MTRTPRHAPAATRCHTAWCGSAGAHQRALTALRSVTFALLALLAALASAQTAADTLIVNQARAVIRGEVVVHSNRVATLVQSVCAVRVLPIADADAPAQRFAVLQGGSVVVPFRAVNLGNAAFWFDLDWALDASARWQPLEVRFFRDLARSGRVDPGDPELTTGIHIEPGADAALLMLLDVPVDQSGPLLISPTVSCRSDDEVALRAFAPGVSDDQRVNVAGASYSEIRLVGDSGSAVNARMAFSALERDATSGIERTLLGIELSNLGAGSAHDVRFELPLPDGCFTLEPDASDPGVNAVEVLVEGRWLALESHAAAVRDGSHLASEVESLRFERSELAPEQHTRIDLAFSLDPQRCDRLAGLSAEVHSRDRDEAVTTSASAYVSVSWLAVSRLERQGVGSEPLRSLLGQPVCIDVRLDNLGRGDDVYQVVVSTDLPAEQAGAVQTSLRNLADLPIDPVVDVGAGDGRLLRACATPSDLVDAFELRVEASSSAGAPLASTSVLVAATTPNDGLSVALFAEPGRVVAAGDSVRFVIRLRNDYDFELTDVRVRFDVLDAINALGAVEALPYAWRFGDSGVSFEAATGVVRWERERLAAGEERSVAFVLRARPDLGDDTRLPSLVSVRAAELDAPVVSDTLTLTVWSSQLLTLVTVTPDPAAPGGTISVRVDLSNPSERDLDIQLVSTPPPGAEPIDTFVEPAPGTAGASTAAVQRRDGEVSEAGDPCSCSFAVLAGGSAAGGFLIRLPAVAADQLGGSVRVLASNGEGVQVLDLELDYLVAVDQGVFRRDRGLLVGHVFSDEAGDGRYDPSGASALPGVRVILPDGRQTFTDAAGRYAFSDLPTGWWRVQLDPATLPAPLADSPTRVSASAHRVLVQGVTRLDVAVEPLRGGVALERSSTLRFGPITLEQRHSELAGLTLRLIALDTSEPVSELELRWVDADGATRSWSLAHLEGPTRRAFLLPAGTPFVDPEVVWRLE